jgi:VanZ family protein
MSRRSAWSLLALLMAALLVGTQMPNSWRNGIQASLHAPSALSSWAHFVVFASMALLLSIRPLSWPVGKVLLLTFTLACTTEGLQFFALDRHPRLIDVAIDMAGALAGLLLGHGFLRYTRASLR